MFNNDDDRIEPRFLKEIALVSNENNKDTKVYQDSKLIKIIDPFANVTNAQGIRYSVQCFINLNMKVIEYLKYILRV